MLSDGGERPGEFSPPRLSIPATRLPAHPCRNADFIWQRAGAPATLPPVPWGNGIRFQADQIAAKLLTVGIRSSAGQIDGGGAGNTSWVKSDGIDESAIWDP